jgi:hypothetical protein
MQANSDPLAAARTVYTLLDTSFGDAVFSTTSADSGQQYGRSDKAPAVPALGSRERETPAAESPLGATSTARKA